MYNLGGARRGMFLSSRAIGLCCMFAVGLTSAGCGKKGPAPTSTAKQGEVIDVPDPTRPAVLPDYHALVIGINEYDQSVDAPWSPLKTARQDAEAVARVLSTQYGFSVQTLVDKAANRNAIVACLERIATLPETCAVMIYYAGHGLYREAIDEGYWIPSDARLKPDGRYATEDWVWNSTITKMMSNAKAKHVLIVADSCYSGSLFRGGETLPDNRQLQWYRRAMNRPSRFLITSGDLEPVLDSGAGHSIFGQQVLNYLRYPVQDVFSASDLGQAVRQQVSSMTGQLVRMGQLPVPSHAGGEFVFVAQEQAAQQLATVDTYSPADDEPVVRAEPDESPATTAAAPPQSDVVERVKDILLIEAQGATNLSQQLLTDLTESVAPDHALVRQVAKSLSLQQKQQRSSDLRSLIEKLETLKQETSSTGSAMSANRARPRILACVGPSDTSGLSDNVALARLYRMSLLAELDMLEACHVVERESLETILAELQLGAGELSDERAKLVVGKVLPASVLLLGDMTQSGDSRTLFLRLVDTETTKLLGSFPIQLSVDSDPMVVASTAAEKIVQRMRQKKPLAGPVLSKENGGYEVGLGKFHGVAPEQVFDILHVQNVGTGDRRKEQVIGTARLESLGETTCLLRPLDDTVPADIEPASLRVRERR